MEHYILNKIADDVAITSESEVITAKESAKKRVENVRAELAADFEAAVERARVKSEQESHQAQVTAKAVALRAEQTAKKEALDSIFADASKKILASDRKSLEAALTKKFSKTGDKVTAHKDGGIVIDNAKYTLSLTMDELMDDLRGRIELEVSKMLF